MINNLQLIKKKINPETSNCQDYLTLVKAKMTEPVQKIEKFLIAQIKSGDSSAFTIVFSAYYKDLVLFALRIIKEIDSSEEIVQDAFVKFWEDREALIISSSLKSYLLKTIKNRCIDWYRHKKIVQNHNNLEYSKELPLDYDTDNYILYSELKEKIDAIIGRLPKEISEAFQMNRYQGLKYHEIAEIQGVSVRTIEMRIGKALKLLRNHLIDYLHLIIFIFSLFFNHFTR